MEPMDDEPLFTVGLEDPPPEPDGVARRPRWWLLAGLAALLAGAIVLPGALDRTDPIGEPDAAPLEPPDYRPTTPTTPTTSSSSASSSRPTASVRTLSSAAR